MRGGMGNPPLVSGTRYHDQSSSYSRQIQYIGRTSFDIGQTSQNRRGFGSIGGVLFSKCSIIPVWICLRHDFVTFYVSPVLDNHALAIDALSMNWNFLHAYAFPPTILIPTVLAKIRQSRCRIILIAPLWRQSLWFSEVLFLLVSAPTLSKTTDTIKTKVSTSKSPITCSSRLGVIKQSIRDKKNRKTL